MRVKRRRGFFGQLRTPASNRRFSFEKKIDIDPAVEIMSGANYSNACNLKS